MLRSDAAAGTTRYFSDIIEKKSRFCPADCHPPAIILFIKIGISILKLFVKSAIVCFVIVLDYKTTEDGGIGVS